MKFRSTVAHIITIATLVLGLGLVQGVPSQSFQPSIAEARGRSSPVHVRGYYRKNGTYVQPHYRSAPDGNFQNNWSTKGNVNPYTGVAGTKVTPPSGYGAYPGDTGTNVLPVETSIPEAVSTLSEDTEISVGPPNVGVDLPSLVRSVQYALKLAGEDPGPLDGVLGEKTEQAFSSFAARNGSNDPLGALKALVQRAEHVTSRELDAEATTSTSPIMRDPVSSGTPATFTVGSTAIDVLIIHGFPDAVRSDGWYYGKSRVVLGPGSRVASWTQVDRELRTR